MHFEKFVRAPSVIVSFTLEEVGLLMYASSSHYDASYDASYDAAGRSGGFLLGVENRTKWGVADAPEGPLPTHTLTFRQVDLLAKISEPIVASQALPKLVAPHRMLLHLLEELNREYLRLNP